MAGTSRYATEARALADEIRESIESDEDAFAETDTAVQDMTYADWIDFRTEAAEHIAAFASATPSARRRRRWKPPLPLLRLAAYQFCLEAACLLDVVDELEPGGAYRAMLHEAGRAAQQVRGEMNWILLKGYDGEPLRFRQD